jgi:type IV secretion system protein VirB2
MSTNRSIFSARNPAAAASYALMAFLAQGVVLAGDTSGGATTTVTTFLTNVASILNLASLAVVTIAIVFAGYQIAFNNKRISEVAPILLGGVLIGGAGQIARMLLQGGSVTLT